MFWYYVFLNKIESTHRPFVVTSEEVERIRSTLIQFFCHTSWKKLKSFNEHSLKLSLTIFWFLFEILPQFLYPSIFLVFICIRVIEGFFLAHWSIKVNMLLLQLIHGRINLNKQTVCVGENWILCSENILLQFTDIIA